MLNKLILTFFVFISSKFASKESMSKQLRKPTGIFGRITCWTLNISNMPNIQFLLSQHAPQATDTVLDIGFGPGQFFELLLKNNLIKKACGIDFSKDSVAFCQTKYNKYIKKGKLELKEASIENIPYEDSSFELIYTCNTLYFWPNAGENIKEVYRVLKPGGKFIMGFSPGHQLELLNLDFNVFNKYSLEDVTALLKSAGFQNVRINQKPLGKFIAYAAIGEK